MRGVFALSAEPREQTPDAGAFEIVVVAAVVGGDEELHARISPNFPVILRDAGHRPLFPDVEAQHQIGARVEHAERNLGCVGILLRPVAASYRLRFDAAESGLDGPFVGRDDACYFPYLHDPFPLLLLLHRLCRFMRCGSAPRSRPRCGTFGRSVPPCFAAGGIGRGCVRGCGRGILSCNRCRRRCSPSGSAIPVRT